MNKNTFIFLGFCAILLANVNPISAQDNIASRANSLKTSYVSTWETISAINDGYEPKNSTDKGPGAYGNWNTAANFNKWNWVEYDFNSYYTIDRSAVYWWDDGQGIEIPYNSYIEYWNIFTEEWVQPANVAGNGVLPDQYNTTTFDPVLTNKIRLYCISTAAQGILEWKVFGTVVEDAPVGLSLVPDVPLSPGTTTTFTITAKNGKGAVIPGYQFYVDVDIINELSEVAEAYQINEVNCLSDSLIALAQTDVNGMTTLTIALPSTIDPTDGIALNFKLNDKRFTFDTYKYFSQGITSPTLMADNSQNDVDHSIEISFTDNQQWRERIYGVTVNGETLTEGFYDILPGVIRLKPALGAAMLTLSGTKSIVVKSRGYTDSQVSQVINAGVVNVLQSYIDSTINFYRPSKTVIPVYAFDAYRNPVQGYTFYYDIEYLNNNQATDEEYVVGNTAISESTKGLLLAATDAKGKTTITLKVPQVVDVNDGIVFNLKLNDNKTAVGGACGYIHNKKEKDVYFPKELNGKSEFSWEQTAQSDNFTAFWGAKTGPDPFHPLAGASFDPKAILDNLESFYSFYVDSMKFILNPDTLNMGKYKFVVILFDTWKSGYESTGSAYGGSVDGVIGAMWMSPMSGFVVAHEFGHASQAMIPIQYPGKGFKDKGDSHVVGMYWEACANYMAYLSTGQLGNVFSPLFINTAQLQYLSTIDYRQYEFIYFPAYIIDKYGIDALGKQWRAAEVGDNPFDAFMRGMGMSRDEMRREAGLWAMHNVTWDYSIGSQIRGYFYGLDESARTREYTYPEKVAGTETFIVPREMAPADYGYNIIPVFPDEGATSIKVTLTGYANNPAKGGGWSYGFVAVDNTGKPRYGNAMIETDGSATLNIEPTDSLFYLVVLASPQQTNTYVWTPAWPKVYRFPYALAFENALPAGHKAGYNSQRASVSGAAHSNGGGWVASTAKVDASAYVGPNAQVLGTAKVTGNARIEDFALVSGSAQVKDNAIVCGNAIVGKAAVVGNNARVEKSARVYGGKISGHGVVTGSAAAVNCKISDYAVVKDVATLNGVTLSGSAIVGGDKTSFTSCSEGLYLSLNQSSCDEKIWDAKIAADVNQVVDEYYYPLGDIPQAPDNVKAKAVGGSTIVLSWDEAMDDQSIVNYILFQNGKPLHLATGICDTITDLHPQTAYTYTVRSRDNAGNISEESEAIEVNTLVSTVILGAEEFAVSITPNPVTNSFTIETSGADISELTIFNLVGEVVFEKQISDRITLDKSCVEKSGIYMVKVKCGEKVQVKKLVVQ
jgi:carbonic anhydrase/acetyltransferase-like protein (isoleucine patch superfamily)